MMVALLVATNIVLFVVNSLVAGVILRAMWRIKAPPPKKINPGALKLQKKAA